MPLAVQPAVLH